MEDCAPGGPRSLLLDRRGVVGVNQPSGAQTSGSLVLKNSRLSNKLKIDLNQLVFTDSVMIYYFEIKVQKNKSTC